MRPIIGITGNQRQTSNHDIDNLDLSYVPTDFVRAVTTAGGVPLILPIGDSEMAKAYVSMVDKIILSGGQNVDPSYYGQDKQAAEDDFLLERDIFEIAVIQEALKQNKPIFAVCRGMQLLNVVLGGTLHQDIKNHWQADNYKTVTQDLMIDENSLLSQIYGSSTRVNSFHRQCIDKLAPNLKIVAYDPKDQMIEAVESTNPNHRLLAVQWHPELLQSECTTNNLLFQFVVNHL